MKQQPSKPNKTLSILNVAYTLFNLLGHFESTLDSRGDRLRTYEAKRSLFTEEMFDALLAAFAGTSKIKNKQDQKSIATQQTFEYLFEKIEDLIFILQRSHDSSLYEDRYFNDKPYFLSGVVLISEICKKGQDLITKSCPLIYLKECVYEIKKHHYNTSQTTRNIISKRLDYLRNNKEKSSIAIYEQLGKIDESKNHTKSFSSIEKEVAELRTDLESLFEKNLTLEQEEVIQEIQGIYICMAALSRLRFTVPPLTEQTPSSAISDLCEYFELADNLQKRNMIWHNNYSKLLIFEEVDIIINHNPSDPYNAYNLFLKMNSQFIDLLTSLEHLTSKKLDSIIQQLKPTIQAYPKAANIIECLNHLKQDEKYKAINSIEKFLPELNSAPYSLRKFVCTLHVGLTLSKGFKITPNSLGKYINIYLETSLPSLHMYPTNENGDDEEFLRSAQVANYDFNTGLMMMIKEYNKLITNSGLSLELFLVNPLLNISSFLDKFLINYYKNEFENNQTKRIQLSLDRLETSLRKAKVPLINFSILDLKSDFIIDHLGLRSGPDFVFPGSGPIKHFLDLPDPTRKAMLEAWKARLKG